MYEADNEWYSHPDFLGRGGFRSANTDIIFECNGWFCVIREIQSDIKIEYFWTKFILKVILIYFYCTLCKPHYAGITFRN